MKIALATARTFAIGLFGTTPDLLAASAALSGKTVSFARATSRDFSFRTDLRLDVTNRRAKKVRGTCDNYTTWLARTIR